MVFIFFPIFRNNFKEILTSSKFLRNYIYLQLFGLLLMNNDKSSGKYETKDRLITRYMPYIIHRRIGATERTAGSLQAGGQMAHS
jgi:hypothetical protein